MEDLLTTIERTCLVSEGHNISKRKGQFKCNGLTEESARDKRRAQLLEDYKKKRDLLLSEKRGLIEDDFSDSEDWMDWEDMRHKGRQKAHQENCRNQLMLSEWLLDRPYDIETAWTIVLCPEGQRTLIVAKKGSTRAFHKNGKLIARFRSILPFGSPSSRGRNSDIVILDCIWKAKTRQLFALDVLFWKNQPLLNCDAQFRMYWLKSKIYDLNKQDLPQTQERDRGMYDVHLPSHCSLSSLSSVLAHHDPSQVDGVLFYHNSAPYISGQTPLVGWLKPYMLPERFGVDVPKGFLDLRPPDYENLEQWVSKVSHTHSKQSQGQDKEKPRRQRRRRRKEMMELDLTTTSEDSVNEMGEVVENADTTQNGMGN
uniref:Snurportin-1 n=1 Tax=Graphocephala atropunctata TaxID=36148 RepID=A0A1B6LFT9_9HEMI